MSENNPDPAEFPLPPVPEKRTLHRASWVVPVSAPPIADGGVVTEGGHILAVGRFKDLGIYNAEIIDHDCIITPSLVNAHAHLELSYLADIATSFFSFGLTDDFTAWVEMFLKNKEKRGGGDDNEKIASCAREALGHLHEKGVGLVADLGNDPQSSRTVSPDGCRVLFFYELLGLSRQAEKMALEQLYDVPDDMTCTAHALYSCSAELIRRIKNRTRFNDSIFPIHVAESKDEIQFLLDGGGRMQTFLEKRGAWDGLFTPPKMGAIEYLDHLRVLDEKTLCVHAVHITEPEIELLAERGAKVCLCPGSNRNLGIGKAPVAGFLKHNIVPALGTDSLASNQTLNIWREMQILMEDHPELDPETVFSMATLGGAAALGLGNQYGELSRGKRSSLLGIYYKAKSSKEIFEYLATAGEMVAVRWLV